MSHQMEPEFNLDAEILVSKQEHFSVLWFMRLVRCLVKIIDTGSSLGLG